MDLVEASALADKAAEDGAPWGPAPSRIAFGKKLSSGFAARLLRIIIDRQPDNIVLARILVGQTARA